MNYDGNYDGDDADDDDENGRHVPLVKRGGLQAGTQFFFAPHYTSHLPLAFTLSFHHHHDCADHNHHNHHNYGDYEKGWNIRLHDDGRKSWLQVKRGRG